MVVKRIDIHSQTAELWNQDDDNATSPLRSGFDIRISSEAPPSFVSAKMPNCSVSMIHEIELIGYLSGAVQQNKRVSHPITVLPQVVLADASLVAAQSKWKQTGARKHFRRYRMWGERGDVEASLALPDHMFPFGTDVPFTLNVVAKSEPGASDSGKDAWPTHELRQDDVDLAIYQLVDIHLQGSKPGWNAKMEGGAYMKVTMGNLDLETRERKWEEGEGAPGRWIRRTIAKSTLQLQCPAEMTFNVQNTDGTADVTVKHFLSVKIRLGTMAHLSMLVPLKLVFGTDHR